MKRLSLFFLLLLSPGLLRAQATDVARAAASITEEDFYRKVEIIAHDSMMGRATPSPGLDMTARWIAEEFRRVGLKPGGDAGSFIQEYALQQVGADLAASRFTFSTGASLDFGDDVRGFWGAPTDREVTAEFRVLVGGDALPEGFSDDARGRHLFILPPEDFEAGGRRAFYQLLQGVAAAEPATVLLLLDGSVEEWRREAQNQRPSTRTPWEAQEEGLDVLAVRLAAFEALLEEVGLDPDTESWPGGTILTPSPGTELTIHARSRVLSEIRAPNTVGILEGSDPELKDEYLVYSGHMDHIGVRSPNAQGDSIANGADDDASGTIALVELAEAFAMMDPAPRRSIIFLAVSGEERGLWGSSYFASSPPVPVGSMVANLNADMIARNWSDTIVVIGKEHSDLGETMERVAREHPELNMAPIDDIWPQENFYRRSDHFNFARRGVPVLFFFNGPHEDYHQVTDEVERIDAEKASRIVRLMFYLGLEVANATERPRWDPESYARIVGGG